ncbi:MAG: molybdopterin-dependent oxidoreductase [Candidatus Binataceae bacterium]
MRNQIAGLLVILSLLTACPAVAHDGSNPYPSGSDNPVFTCDGGVSNSFDVTGDVINPQTFSLTNLQAIEPSTTVQDYFVAGSSTSQGEYSGVLLWDLLNLVGIQVNPAVKNDLDRKYIVVTGTDCYQAVFAMGEVDPTLGGSDQVTVAYAQWVSGQETNLGNNGFARLIIPGDKKGARSVSNVAHIQVISVLPPSP